MVWSFLKKSCLTTLVIFLMIGFWGLSQSPSFFLPKKVLAETFQSSVIVTVCGNEDIETGETCDDGESNSNYGYYTAESRGYCLTDCSGFAPYCGDGTVQSGYGEECDDGDRTSGDGCSSSCQEEEEEEPSPTGGGGGGGAVYMPPSKETKVILQGKAYPGASITVLEDGKVATTKKADSQANFKVVITDVTPGVWTFGLWAEDKEGRKSVTFSFTTTIKKDMTTTIGGIFIPPTIELEKVKVSRGETLTIFGQTAPESEITISVESPEITKETEADEEGSWDYPFDTSPLTEGSHTTRAKAETPEGLLSSYSKVLSFYVGKYGTEEIRPKADFNKDGKTNLVDFSIMLYWWGKYNPAVDSNQNGIVDLPDFSILMYWWTG